MKNFDLFHIAMKRFGTYAARKASEPTTCPSAERIQRKLDAKTLLAIQKWLDEESFCIPDMSISQVADSLGISPLQLSRYCRLVHGMPFLSWRKTLRLEYAARLLQDNPDMSMAEISHIVGICDRGNFRKQFIEYKGCTPKQWREKQEGVLKS